MSTTLSTWWLSTSSTHVKAASRIRYGCALSTSSFSLCRQLYRFGDCRLRVLHWHLNFVAHQHWLVRDGLSLSFDLFEMASPRPLTSPPCRILKFDNYVSAIELQFRVQLNFNHSCRQVEVDKLKSITIVEGPIAKLFSLFFHVLNSQHGVFDLQA